MYLLNVTLCIASTANFTLADSVKISEAKVVIFCFTDMFFSCKFYCFYYFPFFSPLRWHSSPSIPEQTDSWQDHSCHRHYHGRSGGLGVPGTHQNCPRTQEAGVIQEWLHELGPPFLCLLWTHCCSQTQGEELHVYHSNCRKTMCWAPMMIQPC